MSKRETAISWALVYKFFGGDFNKAYTWWTASNPLLGYISPYEMIALGREKKLLKWIKQQIKDNK